MRRGRGACTAGLEPLTLTAKEGLALINGTDGMLGMLVLAIADLRALFGSRTSPRRCRSRRCSGPTARSPPTWWRSAPSPGRPTARQHRAVLAAADRREPRYDDPRVQDAYSLRCAPQVSGAARDTLDHAAGSPRASWPRRSTIRW